MLRSFLLGCVFVSAAMFAADKPDPHLSAPLAPLFARSAFAHGYMHGYEDGFHVADLDIQMGHTLPEVHARHSSQDFDPGYAPGFGDRGLYLAGYREGARAGYSDGITGREFRAIAEIRAAALDLEGAQPAAHFDRGFADGYFAGQKYGTTELRQLTDFDFVGAYCRTSLEQGSSVGEYCNAYARGYRLGYADGRAQQPTAAAPQTARRSAIDLFERR